MVAPFYSPLPPSRFLVPTGTGEGPLMWHAHVGLLRPPHSGSGATVVHGPCLCRAVQDARSGLQVLSPHPEEK